MASTITTAALAAAEKIINGALQYDPGTRIGLANLSGQILAVEVTAPSMKIFVMPTDTGLLLMGNWQGEVDTRLSGSLIALVQLIQSDIHNLKDSGVTVTGTTALLAELQRLLKNLDIDWEEILSQLTGDIVGHQTAQILRSQMSWATGQAANLKRLTGEFLTEELKAIPSKNELENFYHQVDELRLEADRVAARLEKLIKAARS